MKNKAQATESRDKPNVFVKYREYAISIYRNRLKGGTLHLTTTLLALTTGIYKIYLTFTVHPLGLWGWDYVFIPLGAFIAGYPEEVLRAVPVSTHACGSYGMHQPYSETLLPFLISIMLRLNLEIRAVLLLQVTFNIFAGYMVYLFGSRLYDRSVGLISCALVSLNHFYWIFSYRIFNDVLVVFLGTVTTLLFYLGNEKNKGHYLWHAGILLALTAYMDPQALLLSVIFLTFLLLTQGLDWMKNRHMYMGFFFFALTCTIWGLFNVKRLGYAPFFGILYPDVERHGQKMVSFLYPMDQRIVIASVLYKLLYYLSRVPYILSAFVSLFAVLGIWKALTRRSRADILILLWLSYYLTAAIFLQQRDRYMLYWFIPLIFFSAIGLRSLSKRIGAKKFAAVMLFALFSTYNHQPIPFLYFTRKLRFLGFHPLVLPDQLVLEGATVNAHSKRMIALANMLSLEGARMTILPVWDALCILSMLLPLVLYICRCLSNWGARN